ncbi:hypothetical protein [Ornithinibacillus sp. FSL M8-0202]|uniref:hypothetical protein n=1 Tax=unclassified Ornithinibacillus TaxID=2620869 RepID=UPI0030CFD035
MKRNERITYKTTSFLALFRIYRFRTLIFNFSFLIAAVLSASFYFFYKDINTTNQIVNFVGTTLSSISASLLGIVIAGLAILIALTQGKTLSILLQRNVLQIFLFPFWILSFFWGISTLICIAIIFLDIINFNYLFYLITFEVFIFTYSVLSTIQLMGHAIRLGLFLADYENDS